MDAQEKEEAFINIREAFKPGKKIVITHLALDDPTKEPSVTVDMEL